MGVNFDAEGVAIHVSLSDPNKPEIGAREGSTIVKVQLALNGRANPALIYDRGQTFRIMVKPAGVAERMAGRPKAYFYAQVSDGQVTLGDEAPRQDW